MQIVDLRAGKHMETITGLHEPQGVGFVPEFNEIFVANAKGGACEVLAGSSFQLIKSIKFSDDADKASPFRKFHGIAHWNITE